MSLTAHQLEVRQTGIGASEAPAALNMSPHQSALELYLKKTGALQTTVDALPLRYGNFIETFILDEFQLEHPELTLQRAPDTMRNGVMLAHLDAWVPRTCNVQAKSARSREGYGEPGSSDIPVHHLIQVQQEMLLAMVPVSYVPVLFYGAEYAEFVVEADRELQEMIQERVNEFWGYVTRGEPPRPDWDSPAVLEIVRKVYPGTSGEILTASEHQETLYRALCDAKEREAGAGKAADGLQSLLLWDMAEAAELRFSDGKMLRRKKVTKKGYTVEPFTYTDARIVARKEGE